VLHGKERLVSIAVAILFAAALLVAAAPHAFSQLDPDLKEALDTHKAGKLREAVDIYSEFIEKHPRSAEAFNWRGMAYDDMNELDKALADFNHAISISPRYADAYNNRGEIYRKKKMFPQAMADYRKAADLEKNFAEAHYNMGLILEQEKKYGPAANEFTKYLSLKPAAEDTAEVDQKLKEMKKLAAQAPRPTSPPPAGVKPGERPGAPPGAKPAPEVASKPGAAPGARPGVAPGARPGAAPGARPGLPGPPGQKPAPAGMDTGIPGLGPLPVPPEAMALIAGAGIVAMILPLLVYIFSAVMLFLIARKTNTELPWLAFIPIANVYLMVRIADKPLWWLAILFLPIISPLFAVLAVVDPTGGIIPMVLTLLVVLACVAAWLMVCLGIAAARGKSIIWGILFFIPCTSPIGMAYLGLSK